MSDVTSIPGVETVHARSTWTDPRFPFRGNRVDISRVTRPILHYTAADDLIDGDPGEYADRLDEYMRAMQQSYVQNRRYSLGYWWAVDWLGGAWQCRGWEFVSAANVGDPRKTGVVNINPQTAPILCLVDGADRLTAEAAATVRALIRETRRRSGRSMNRPAPHSALDFTACCGDGIRLDIDAGLTDADYLPPPVPVTPPPVPPTGKVTLMVTVFKPTDCLAEFIGMTDANGNALEVEWISTAEDQRRRNAHIAAGARVDTGAATRGRFRNCTLIGWMPTGDTYPWSVADFHKVRP